jgi:PAS domain S-box-containing protein
MNNPKPFPAADLHELLIQGVVDYAIYMLDPQGRVVSWNTGAERIKGYTAEEIIGEHFSRFYTEEDRLRGAPQQALQTALETGRFTTEAWRVRKDGSRFWAMVVIDPIHRDGKLIGFGKVTRDLTERREAQLQLEQSREQLFQAQKMEALGQLTGGLAHDFNNLLAGIMGSLELLETRIAQGRLDDLNRYVATAKGAAERAAALTHRLLAFARRQTLDPRPTNVNRLIAGMEDLIRRTVGPAITVEVIGGAGLWPVLADPNQLESALLNLCINARDAMPEGGRITIETTNKWMDARMARERDLPPGQFISLCVTDTGTGMAPELIERVFDPFFTTKPLGQGTGLGLSMVYGFVRQSGGQVRIYSELGQGTTMCLYLPRYRGAEEDAEPLAEFSTGPRAEQGETVLVVDDEPTVRMLVTEVLEDLGYTAIEAADGPSGLKLLQSPVRIDLLISDVGLPGGLNGRQLADAGRQVRPKLKVLFITGYADNAVIGNGHLEPGMHVLTKPFAMEALASRIKAVIKDG